MTVGSGERVQPSRPAVLRVQGACDIDDTKNRTSANSTQLQAVSGVCLEHLPPGTTQRGASQCPRLEANHAVPPRSLALSDPLFNISRQNFTSQNTRTISGFSVTHWRLLLLETVRETGGCVYQLCNDNAVFVISDLSYLSLFVSSKTTLIWDYCNKIYSYCDLLPCFLISSLFRKKMTDEINENVFLN